MSLRNTISNEYLINLENEQLRERIKEYRSEIARLKAEIEVYNELQKKKARRARTTKGQSGSGTT
jgi:uncharacterized small protein (DUF1192 family)